MAMTPLRVLEDLVLRALTDLDGGATPQQVIDRILAGGFNPTSEDVAHDSNGRPAWHARVRLARRHLGDDDLVRVKGRRWELTARASEHDDARSAGARLDARGNDGPGEPAAAPAPQPTTFMSSVISPALTDPRIREPRKARGPGIKSAEDESMSVIIELNVALPGGAYWAYQHLQQLFVELKLVDHDHPMPAQFDEYVSVHLPMNTIEQLVKTDIEGSGVANRLIYRVWPNFPVHSQIDESVRTIKADAAVRAFNARGKGITWAVVDSGIDKTHPHFAAGDTLGDLAVADLHRDFTVSLTPDADTTESALQDSYGSTGHGTGVASIIAGHLPAEYSENDLEVLSQQLTAAGDPNPLLSARTVAPANLAGMAPDARLVSLKVLSDDSDSSNVLTVIAALRYVMQINNNDQAPRIHGVNLSLGYEYDPAWFACGQSPLCQAVDRLVRSGVVVVVAAGNTGFATFGTNFGGRRASGLSLSINDPGNADRAITVGATHRTSPYTYGVSYFSSKGPTGDGRQKPDLVAPGERITVATTADDAAGPRHATYSDVSGTSFAAPHVSGAVAAFLSVRPEFVGRPEQVKQILVESAQPLGRERQFEGGGLLDIMRALQSV